MFRFQYGVHHKASRSGLGDFFRLAALERICGYLRANAPGAKASLGSWQPAELEVVAAGEYRSNHVITIASRVRKWAGLTTRSESWLAQWVSFEEAAGAGSACTPGETSCIRVKIAGQTAGADITSFTKTWYENFRVACDQMAATSGD